MQFSFLQEVLKIVWHHPNREISSYNKSFPNSKLSEKTLHSLICPFFYPKRMSVPLHCIISCQKFLGPKMKKPLYDCSLLKPSRNAIYWMCECKVPTTTIYRFITVTVCLLHWKKAWENLRQKSVFFSKMVNDFFQRVYINTWQVT